MITATPLEEFVQSQSFVPFDLEAGKIPTLAIQWDVADEIFWTLRLTEFFGDRNRTWGYQPPVEWSRKSDGVLSYEGCPAATGDTLRICSCKVEIEDDVLKYELAITNRADDTIEDCWGWLCLIHRWARAFQSNLELPAGTEEKPWVPAASLEAPLGRWLKWCPVVQQNEIAHRIGKNAGARWQPHIQALEGAVRAWRAVESQQQFIQLSSPDAVLLGWSHWPCTDMGVYFGTLAPGETGRASGRLEFLKEEYAPI